MPKEITSVTEFAKLTKPEKAKKDAKAAKAPKKTLFIKKNGKVTKFKIRKGKYLYTFQTDKVQTIKKLTEGLNSNVIDKVEIKKRRVAPKKAKK